MIFRISATMATIFFLPLAISASKNARTTSLHSAARTPWGARWIHLFGFGSGHAAPTGGDVPAALGLLPGYAPEFIELRTADGDSDSVTQRPTS